MMNNFLNGMFGKVGSGMCRLSMNGGIAVKTMVVIRHITSRLASSQTVVTLYLILERNSSLLFQLIK